MTPAARISAAIDILDAWQDGEAVEKLLTGWARRSRFAGSKDRAAVRDLVFTALRNLNSFAVLGGVPDAKDASGRALMAGMLRAGGEDPELYFTGGGYAPAPLAEDELNSGDPAQTVDVPAWLLPQLRAALGDDFAAVEQLMRHRAPLFLRVNETRATPDEIIAQLANENIASRAHDLSKNALEVTENPRKFSMSEVYRNGLAEVQDVASQAVSDRVPLPDSGGTVLDYCAGGGGKSLALAARSPAVEVFAHDISAARMKDIPERARRAGSKITIVQSADLGSGSLFDLVLADAPCSGSGAWRRTPESKWRLTPERLAELNAIQDDVLQSAARHVCPGGGLTYVTCSLLTCENQERVTAFLASRPTWQLISQHHFTPLDGGDGFYTAMLRAPLTDE